MSNLATLAATATAAMVAVVGITLLSPSSSPSATAQQLGSRHTVTEDGVRFSFRVPQWETPTKWDNWDKFSSLPTNKSPGGPISLNKSIVGPQGAEAIIYWTSFPAGDYADPCARLLNRSIGRSADKLAAAVSRAPGTKLVKGPLNITLDGHPAKHVVLKVRQSVGCNPGFFYTWRDVRGGELWRRTEPGNMIRVWIVKVDGRLLFIQAATTPAAGWLNKEVLQIVESIRFG